MLHVTRVSTYGFSLVIGGDELRLRYTTFPWFRTTHPERLTDVEWHSPGQLYWPTLGIELSESFVRRLATVEPYEDVADNGED
jgi:hypothetical protein